MKYTIFTSELSQQNIISVSWGCRWLRWRVEGTFFCESTSVRLELLSTLFYISFYIGNLRHMILLMYRAIPFVCLKAWAMSTNSLVLRLSWRFLRRSWNTGHVRRMWILSSTIGLKYGSTLPSQNILWNRFSVSISLVCMAAWNIPEIPLYHLKLSCLCSSKV